jgi:hypothetical protein
MAGTPYKSGAAPRYACANFDVAGGGNSPRRPRNRLAFRAGRQGLTFGTFSRQPFF